MNIITVAMVIIISINVIIWQEVVSLQDSQNQQKVNYCNEATVVTLTD